MGNQISNTMIQRLLAHIPKLESTYVKSKWCCGHTLWDNCKDDVDDVGDDEFLEALKVVND